MTHAFVLSFTFVTRSSGPAQSEPRSLRYQIQIDFDGRQVIAAASLDASRSQRATNAWNLTFLEPPRWPMRDNLRLPLASIAKMSERYSAVPAFRFNFLIGQRRLRHAPFYRVAVVSSRAGKRKIKARAIKVHCSKLFQKKIKRSKNDKVETSAKPA